MKNVIALGLIAISLVACGKKEEAPAPAAEVAAPAVEVGKPADDKVEAPAPVAGSAVVKEEGKQAVK